MNAVVDGQVWSLSREREGSALQASHPRWRYTVEIDHEGDLVFDNLDQYVGTGIQPFVPGVVLRALITDAKTRGVWED